MNNLFRPCLFTTPKPSALDHHLFISFFFASCFESLKPFFIIFICMFFLDCMNMCNRMRFACCVCTRQGAAGFLAWGSRLTDRWQARLLPPVNPLCHSWGALDWHVLSEVHHWGDICKQQRWINRPFMWFMYFTAAPAVCFGRTLASHLKTQLFS